MKLKEAYYPEYSSVEACEELFLVFSRQLLELQKDQDQNKNEIDYVDITVDEDNKIAQIEIRAVPCFLAGDGLVFPDGFVSDSIDIDTTGDFEIPWPFGQPSLVAALCNLGIFLSDAELKIDSFPLDQKVFSYNFSSNRNLRDEAMFFSLSARNFPLEYKGTGPWQSTKAKTWLPGGV